MDRARIEYGALKIQTPARVDLPRCHKRDSVTFPPGHSGGHHGVKGSVDLDRAESHVLFARDQRARQ